MIKQNKIWNKEETDFLKENYSKLSNSELSKKLNRSEYSIKGKASSLKLKKDKIEKFCDINYLKEIIKNSLSYKEVCDKLNKTKSGATYKIIKRIISEYEIDISHFDPFKREQKSKYGQGYSLDYWLQRGTNISSSKLKEKLYNFGLKERICEDCGQGEEWKGKKMSLILDHINGINNDNRIENLRILCPNCNSTYPTFCRGYKRT